ncbi:MAG: tetratricopeptide repeat protein [Acidobacteriota bacterium]
MFKQLLTRRIKLLLVGFWVIAGAFAFFSKMTAGEKMSVEEYNTWISQTYDFRFGKERPFAPSNATSFNGKFIAGEKFVTSARCASCHTDIHPQWKDSAHANAFREPFYQKNVKDLQEQKNIAFTRHCESCHNPAALFSGALTDKPQFKDRPFDEEGVSCIVCHSINSVNGRGIGGYTMGEPALIVKEDGTRITEATDAEILDDVPGHKRALMRDLLKSPAFCGACHKSQVPQELNDYKFLRAFAVSDELQTSSFSKESPHPFYVRDRESCNSCHMNMVDAKKFDVAATNGLVASHRFAAANTAIPAYYGYKEQLDAVEAFLKNDKLGVDIFAMRRTPQAAGSEDFIAPVNRQSFRLAAGDALTADVVITNKNIGHSFPPELRDFYEAYVEFTVTDDTGRTLFKSGFIKPDGYLDEFAHNYKTYLVKPDGTSNELHHIWQTRVIPQNLAIPSGRSDVARYRFSIPDSLSGNVKLTAKLRYRRFTRIFSDYSIGKPTDFPIVTMASTEKILTIGDNKPDDALPNAMPDWRRWNNYGIALLDQRQFAASADAFAKVIGLDEKYRPFALTNQALALMEIDRWAEARQLITRALELDPNNYRALFQLGRIDRVEGKLADAEAEFARVNKAFPRDRLTLQQLGELAKIKSDYPAAKDMYLQILAIDPEDAGSHYNLMLIYKKLKMKDEAAKEEKIFLDLKDDPRTTALASDFLQHNPAVARRSLPYYVNDLQPFQLTWERPDTATVLGIE